MEKAREQVALQLGNAPASQVFTLMKMLSWDVKLKVNRPANWNTYKLLITHYATKN